MTGFDKLSSADRPVEARKAPPTRPSTAGEALRAELARRMAPLMSLCDGVKESSARLLLQGGCLDLLIGLEEVIEAFGLDGQHPRAGRGEEEVTV